MSSRSKKSRNSKKIHPTYKKNNKKNNKTIKRFKNKIVKAITYKARAMAIAASIAAGAGIA